MLSGNIIGKAASIFSKGYAVLTQNYGPESRGGSCATEIAISDEPIAYPYARDPKVQIILSQEAYTKYGNNAAPDTILIIDSGLVRINEEEEPKPLSIPANRMASEKLGKTVVANIIMLGFLASKIDIVPVEALKEAILDSIPAGTEEINLKAFELGYKYGAKNGDRT